MNIPLPPQFRLSQSPIARHKSTVKIGKLRISILTSRLLRIEYSPDEKFEDRPSQAFWYRDQPTPDFHSGAQGDFFSLETDHLVLTYDPQRDTLAGLSILIKENAHTWHYGDAPTGNLRGTFRTLDRIDGAIPLELGLVSREGWALVDDSQALLFSAEGWLTERDSSPTHDLYFFGHGTDYQGALDDLFKVAGRVPMIPRWALGNWWSRYWAYTDQELLTLMDEFASHNIPLSVCIVDMDWHITDTGGKGSVWSSGWTGYTWNTDLFPDPKGFIAQLHQRKLRTALNLHPHAGVEAHEATYEAMAKWMNQDPTTEAPIPFDIADQRYTQGYFEILHHPHEAIGVDFWWVDWQQGEKTRLRGLDPLWWLNHLHFYDLGRAGQKRPFIFSRWGGLGNHRYPIGFSGDTHTTWASLAFQPYFTASATNVGYSWWSHDIGGHMFGVEAGELYARWVQYGVFSPIMRLHSTKNHYSERRPWGWRNAEIEQVAGNAMRLRHALVPYLYSMAWRNHSDGVALINPMYYTHPQAENAYFTPQQYWFGSQMIVAPYTAPIDADTGVSRQAVWLPAGNWYDFSSGKRYNGGGWTAIYGDLRHIPIFVKDGGIIPLAPITGDNDTPLPQTVHLHRYGDAAGRFVLYEDDGTSNAYTHGDYAETIISAAVGGAMHITPPNTHPTYLPNNRSWVHHHHHHQERDLHAECEALLWRFKMNAWVKDELGKRLTDFMADPLVLRDFITYLTPAHIRALCETAYGVGVHHLTPDMGGAEAFILWNTHNRPDFRYSYTQIDATGRIWGGNPFTSESGIVPAEKIITPIKASDDELLLKTHARLRVDYFGLVTVEF